MTLHWGILRRNCCLLYTSYTVEISVEGALEKLYGGMTADVIFVTEEKADILYVSRKAIVEENGKSYVYRETALGGKELADVETGITNGVDIEILSGLEDPQFHSEYFCSSHLHLLCLTLSHQQVCFGNIQYITSVSYTHLWK